MPPLSLDQMCLPLCFANLASSFSQSGHLAQMSPDHSVSVVAFNPSTGFCILSQFPPKFPNEVAPITLKVGTIVLIEAFALYIKIKKRLRFYFPKLVSGVETLELRQRHKAGQGCPKFRGLSLHLT